MTKNKSEATGTGREIAIIGMVGRFPGARNVHEFWNNLKNGVESISWFSDKELEEAGIDPELINHPDYVKAYGILEDKDYFDAAFFGYTPLESQVMSPQTRILHECTWEVLEDAGYDPGLYDGLIGLYAGATSSSYWEALSHFSGRSDELGGFAATQLNDKDYISARISYNLDLKGPVFSLQTACSTSLVALHLACRGLLMGECKMALAGGGSVVPFPKQGYLFQEGMILSPDGHCRAFDAGAKGTIFGEGAGLVVLKRLKNAIADGDHIYAVIKGTAINNDGSRKVGFTAPSVEGQAEVIQMAQRIAHVNPETISYIETHGTGTTLGDPVEIEALTLAFETDKKGFCAIGSVKSNIGHLDAAAGIAGLIKTVLALNHRQIPPSLHFKLPNPGIDFENSPFYVNTELKEWKNEKYPLRAGLSSFGIGGTNAHAVLEEAPKIPPSSKSREWQMILLSAKTEPALNKMSENLGNYLQKSHSYSGNPINPADPGLNPGLFLADAAYSLQVGRGAFSYRRMAVCSCVDNAITLLSSADSRKVHTFFCRDNFKPVIFMFPGLGGQYVNMGRELYEKEPVFCREMDRCFELLKPLMGYDIKEILYPQNSVSKVSQVSRVSGGEQLGNRLACSESDAPSPRSELSQPAKSPDKMNQLEIAQPLLFVVEYALAKLLIHWGIKPHAVIGYSFGEYTAACLAGVFSLEDALMFIIARGKLIRELPEGLMVSVPLPRHELEPFLNDEISLAIDNGPSCIVSGSTGAIAAFEKKMKENRCMCMRIPQASRAIHSYMMEPVLKNFEKIAGEIPLNMPQITYISNVTGNRAGSEVTKPRYWSTHLRSTVEFAKGIKELAKEQNAVFLEVGPGRDLSAMLTRYIQDNPDQQVLNLIRPSQKDTSDVYFLLKEVGRLWLFGQKIDWKGFYSDEIRHRVSLPSYPFERERYWIDETSIEMGAGKLKKSAAGKKQDIGEWFYIPSWKPSLLPAVQPGKVAEPCTWLVFMDAWGIGEQMVKRLEQDNQEVIVVRPGTAYGKEYERQYTVNPGESSDYKALLTELNTRGIHPREIVHLWNITHHDPDESREEWAKKCQEFGYYSLIFLTHALEDQAFTEEIQITAVTNNMQEVYGDELLYPEKATLLGPVNVIPREYPGIRCRAVDVVLPEPGSRKCEALVRQLLEEIEAKAPDTNVVYRGNNRLEQAYEPVRLEKPASPVRLRKRGIYLVTGGLGDIGLLLAKDMARSVNARLILTGRSEFPAREQWEQWSGKDDAIRSKIEALREIEALGGDVLVCRADVSDLGQMETVVREGEHRFGPINGVIHAALQIDGGVIHTITREKTENVFASKVWGTLVLERIFKDYPLDFMMLFSSLTTVFMEIGHVAYSAGSVFMDAFARHKAAVDGDNRLTICIDWDNWQEVGGALKLAKERAKALGLSDSQAKIEKGILSEEGIEAFHRIIECNLPRIAVSTHDLNERIKDFKAPVSQASSDKITPSKKKYQRPALESEYVPPGNDLERTLVDTWSDFFGFEPIGIQDDFFELGGDSLKGMMLVNKYQKLLGETVYINLVFEAPTIAQLAAYFEKHYPRAAARLMNLEPGYTAVDRDANGTEKVTSVRAAWFREKLPPVPFRRDLSNDKKKNPKAVFILSPPRSGSTLLRVILGGHPRLFAPPELGLLEFNTLDELKTAVETQGIVRAIMQVKGCAVEEAKDIIEDFKSRQMTTKQFYRLIQEWIGDKTLVDKSPNYPLYPEVLERAEVEFENALFIHLLRHPYGMIRSYDEVKMDLLMGSQLLQELSLSTEVLAELIWTVSHWNILEFLKQVPRDRQIRVKFEELVTQSRRIVEDICQFLGLELFPEMLDPYREEEQRMTDGLYEFGRMSGDPKFHSHTAINDRVADRWREHYKVDFLGDVTWETAKLFGYKRIKESTYSSMVPAEEKEYYPLSSAQKRLYFVQQMNPESNAYNSFFPLSVEALLEVQTLEKIFRQLIKRHETFRTSFRVIGGEPIQKIHEDVEFQIEYYEGKEFEDIIGHFLRPFDLAKAPVLRVGLIKTGEQTCLLLLGMHHIMSDGTSIGILTQEFTVLYNGEELPPPQLQYRDFAQWQNKLLHSEEMKKQEEYWLKQFEGRIPVLKLPVDFARAAVQSFEGRWLDFEIGAEETQALKNMARETGTTLYMLLLALFSILLSKICNQDDIVIGTPTAGRRHADLERIIGMFVNTIPIRTYPEGQKTFKGFLAEVKATILDVFENQDYPIERLVEVVVGKRDTSKNPLFDVMFTMQTQGIPEVELEGIKIKYYEYETKIAKFDMQLICVEGDEGLTCTLEYCTKLFREESVTDFIKYFKTIVSSVTHEPGKNLSEIVVVPEEEMKELEFQLLDDLENK